MSITLRDESAADIEAIDEIARKAFLPLAHSSHAEEFMIRALRRAKMLSISLVAEIDTRPVGHIAFSPVDISDGSNGWFGLGPLSVSPEFQRRGIGQALVKRGLEILRDRKASGCVVFGDPNYYGRFGFSRNPDIIFEGAPAKLFLALRFSDSPTRGKVTYHEAFNATA
jgi:predicted N-acetyltransferase YhbS